MATCGLGIGLVGPNANAILADLVPAGRRGRFFGGLTASIFVGQFLSPLSVQWIVLNNGYQGILGAFSLASLLAMAVCLLYLGRSLSGKRLNQLSQ